MAAVPAGQAGWMPTQKWWSGLAAGLFTIAAHAVVSQGWDATEWGELLTLGATLATAYGVSNN